MFSLIKYLLSLTLLMIAFENSLFASSDQLPCDSLLTSILTPKKIDHDKVLSKIGLEQEHYRESKQISTKLLVLTIEFLNELQYDLKKLGVESEYVINDLTLNRYGLPLLRLTFNREKITSPRLRHLSLMLTAGDIKNFYIDPNHNLEFQFRAGQYYSDQKKIILIPRVLISFLNKDYLSYGVTHELKHAYLTELGIKGVPTPYNLIFQGDLFINEKIDFYQKYLNGQELHNYSGDPFEILRATPKLTSDLTAISKLVNQSIRSLTYGIEIADEISVLSVKFINQLKESEAVVERAYSRYESVHVVLLLDEPIRLTIPLESINRNLYGLHDLIPYELAKLEKLRLLALELNYRLKKAKVSAVNFSKLLESYPQKSSIEELERRYHKLRVEYRELYQIATSGVLFNP